MSSAMACMLSCADSHQQIARMLDIATFSFHGQDPLLGLLHCIAVPLWGHVHLHCREFLPKVYRSRGYRVYGSSLCLTFNYMHLSSTMKKMVWQYISVS